MAAIKKIKLVLLTVIILGGSFMVAQARTRLVSLPSRERVTLRMGQDGTALVQEKRILVLKKGVNKLDFSWQNVMIDPTGITLEILSNPDKISILSVSYPPNEAALVWEIHSLTDLEEEVMISYLLANIDGIVTYTAVADPLEQSIDLKSFLVLRNFSGENFDNVRVYTPSGSPFDTSLFHLETKKVLVSQKQHIPIKKIYTWDASKMPHDPDKAKTAVGIPTSYEFKSPLFKGKARLFQQDQQDSTLFLGEDIARDTPVGDKTDLHIGDSRDIIVTQHRLETKKINIKRNTQGNIQIFDEEIKERITMENLKDRPVILSVLETIPGQWKPVDISMEYTLKDHKTLVFNVDLLPKEKKTLILHYRVLNIFAQKFSQYNRVIN